jgi:hypothetical protein
MSLEHKSSPNDLAHFSTTVFLAIIALSQYDVVIAGDFHLPKMVVSHTKSFVPK